MYGARDDKAKCLKKTRYRISKEGDGYWWDNTSWETDGLEVVVNHSNSMIYFVKKILDGESDGANHVLVMVE